MADKVLCDIDILIDALLKRNQVCANLLESLLDKKAELFLTASMVTRLSEITEKNAIDRLSFEKNVLNHFHVISVTGKEFRESLRHLHPEEAIIALAFKRVCNDGIIISRNHRFEMFGLTVFSPEEYMERVERHDWQELGQSIPILDLSKEYRYLQEELDQAILESVAHGKYILGPEVTLLEAKVAEYIGVKHCIGVASGTDALVIALRALALVKTSREYWRSEDLVITTPFTFTATGMAILRAGATPLFVDIDLETYNIDPEQIREAVQKYGDKVKGILPVHLYGNPCDMDQIMQIAQENELFVVEDCAQSFGSKWRGKQTGSFGDAGCFSFFPTKNLGGFGDSGMIATNSDELYQVALMLRKHGGVDKYNVSYIGYNSRLDTLQAAVLIKKFSYIDREIKKRREIAYLYNKKLNNIEEIILPSETQLHGYHTYHQFTVRLERDQDELKKFLRENGIETMIYYPFVLSDMKAFFGRSISFGELQSARSASRSVLSFPIDPCQPEEVFVYISELIHNYFAFLL